MKYLLILSLLIVTLGSCIEELDEIEPNFEKVYGYNLNSKAEGITPVSDGSFLIYGWAERTILEADGQYSHPIKKDSQMPFLVKIDQNGNEIMTRTYPVNQVVYDLALWAEPDDFTFDIEFAYFNNIIEMKNGEFLAFIWGSKGYYYHSGYLILDKNLDIKKIKLLDDSEIEFSKTDYVSRAGANVFLLNSPNNDDVLVIVDPSIYMDSTYSFYTDIFYSMYRISPDGTILDLYDYELDNGLLRVWDITLNSRGNIIVVGDINFSGTEIFVHEIDPINGQIIQENTITGGSRNRRPWQIVSSPNGYLMQISDYNEQHEPPAWSYSSFYDQNFNFLYNLPYAAGIFNIPEIFKDLILNREGGFYSFSFSNPEGMTIFKLDETGSELWRREFDTDTNDGGLIGYLQETKDGGIICLGMKEFNSAGYKIKMIKLDPDGNL